MTTQKRLDELLQTAIRQAKALKIPVSDRIMPHVKVNHRAVSRAGCCRREPSGFQIEISGQLYAEGAEKIILQILCHEVLHTCPECSDHGTIWQFYADAMNRVYGYRITRASSWESLGVQDRTVYRYQVVCNRCGQSVKRVKRGRMVDHPEYYRCGFCGGTLRTEVLVPPS